MITFNSLEEVVDYAHELIGNNDEKALKKLPPETIIDITIGAEYYLDKITREFAERLGCIDSLKRTNFVWPYYCQFNNNWLGVCGGNTIWYRSLLIFFYPYKWILEVVVHEICHFKHHDHSRQFWDCLFDSLKKLGLVNSELKFDDYFTKIPYFKERTSEMRFRSINSLKTFSCSLYDRRYEVLRRNKAFDLKIRDNNERHLSGHYHPYITQVREFYASKSENIS